MPKNFETYDLYIMKCCICFLQMRLAALTFLIDMVYRHKSPPLISEVINRLIEISITDEEPVVRYYVASQFSIKPPLCVVLGFVFRARKKFGFLDD